MTTEWSHLPNAMHIDRILTSFINNPKVWATLYDTSNGNYIISSVSTGIWIQTYNKINDTEKTADAMSGLILHTRNVSGMREGFFVVIEPLAALIAYEDCAYMLDSEPGELKILSTFGNPCAALVWPACVVLSKEKELA